MFLFGGSINLNLPKKYNYRGIYSYIEYIVIFIIRYTIYCIFIKDI